MPDVSLPSRSLTADGQTIEAILKASIELGPRRVIFISNAACEAPMLDLVFLGLGLALMALFSAYAAALSRL